MNITITEIIISLSGSGCIKRIFQRIGVDTNISIITNEYKDKVIQIEKHFYAKCREDGISLDRSGYMSLQYINANTERHPSDILNEYVDSLIYSFTSTDDTNWLSILRNEYEVKVVICIMKFILVVTRLDSIHENFKDYKISNFLDSMNVLIKKIDYNLRISKCLQESLMTAYSHYWIDKKHCNFDTGTILNKKEAIFSRPNNTEPEDPYIPLDDVDVTGLDDNIQKFFSEVSLSLGMRDYLPNIISTLIKTRIKFEDCNKGISKLFQQSQYRAAILEQVVSYVGLQFKDFNSNKHTLLIPNEHAQFIDKYQLSSKIMNSITPQNFSDLTRQLIHGIYPTPKYPDFCFDIYNGRMLDAIQNFYKNFGEMLKLKPTRNIGFFKTLMLGENFRYNEDRVDVITRIRNAQSDSQLLAMRFLWFNSNVFLEHTYNCDIIKFWTITPDGQVSRISERNSHLTLLLSIKTYWIWLNNDKFNTIDEFNNEILEHNELLFMKIARKSYLVGLGDNFDKMNTSSTYRKFISYLNGRISREHLIDYLQLRWLECINKINDKLGINIQALKLEVNQSSMVMDEVL